MSAYTHILEDIFIYMPTRRSQESTASVNLWLALHIARGASVTLRSCHSSVVVPCCEGPIKCREDPNRRTTNKENYKKMEGDVCWLSFFLLVWNERAVIFQLFGFYCNWTRRSLWCRLWGTLATGGGLQVFSHYTAPIRLRGTRASWKKY